MNNDLLVSIEREVLGWPGVTKSRGRFNSTAYNLGRRELGHVHRNGVVDLAFPKTVHDELIAAGRAEPHQAGFPSIVSYYIREPGDVSGALALFRMNYDRAQPTADDPPQRRQDVS